MLINWVVDVSRCWYIDSRCWCIAVLIDRFVDISRCWHIAVLIYRGVNLSRCWYIEVLTYPGVDISRCWYIEVLKYQDVDISRCWYILVLIYRFEMLIYQSVNISLTFFINIIDSLIRPCILFFIILYLQTSQSVSWQKIRAQINHALVIIYTTPSRIHSILVHQTFQNIYLYPSHTKYVLYTRSYYIHQTLKNTRETQPSLPFQYYFLEDYTFYEALWKTRNIVRCDYNVCREWSDILSRIGSASSSKIGLGNSEKAIVSRFRGILKKTKINSWTSLFKIF